MVVSLAVLVVVVVAVVLVRDVIVMLYSFFLLLTVLFWEATEEAHTLEQRIRMIEADGLSFFSFEGKARSCSNFLASTACG